MRILLPGLTFLGASLRTQPAWAQATTRPCGTEEAVGPACLLTRQALALYRRAVSTGISIASPRRKLLSARRRRPVLS